ncbi:MAG: DVUA0089 family protein, partial [Novosphingobium sp.]|nr:DVUA0089 family protein [Novosphingobium sp.]
LGSVRGDGGDGYAGDGFVIATQRFQRTERGSLTAGNVTINSAGIGGTGATAGDSFFSAAQGSEGELVVRQADVNIDSLSLSSSGALAPNVTLTLLSSVDPATGLFTVSGVPTLQTVTITAEPFDLSVTDGTVNIAGDLSLSTPGEMRVSLGASTLNASTLTLAAGNFVLPATRPAVLGTINVANALSISSGLDFLAYANFNVGGDGFFDADGSVETGDLTFGGELDIDALGSITTGNVDAGSVFFSAGQAIATGAVVARENIELVAGGTATTGQLTAGDNAQVSAGGAVTVSGASAGIVNPSTNPNADYNVVLRSLTSISAGDLAARANVGVGSPGTIVVGNVTSGPAGLGFLALAGTGLTTGAITTTGSPNGGQIYLANFSMEPLGGELTQAFDPAPVLAAAPVAIGGPITLNGAVSTGRFQAATTGAFAAQAITAPQGFGLSAGAAVTLGDLSSFTISIASTQSITLGAVTSTATSAQLAAAGQTNGVTLNAAGALTTGAITSAGSIDLTAGQNLTTAAVNVSDGSVEMDAGGALQTGAVASGQSTRLFAGATASVGNVTAGHNPNTQFSVGIAANGAVGVGNVVATRDVGLLSRNSSVSAGNIGTGTSIGVLAAGAVNLGSLTTGTAASNFAYIANASMASLGGTLGPSFNPAPIFAATPVPTTGSITIGGAVTSGNLVAATTGNFTAGAMTLAQRLTLGRAAIAQVDGAWVAPTISLASQRLQFGTSSSAGIGAAGTTTSLTLRALASGQTATLGGTTAGGGYSLTQADFARIRSSNLTIQVDPQGVSSTSPDLEIRDLTLNGSAGGGFTATTITTTGRARVTGDLLLQQAGAMDTLTLNANQKLEIVLPDASLAITGSGGALAGTLTVSSDNLVAGTLDLLMQVMEDPDASGLVERFKTPASSTPNLDGYIRADGVRLKSNANILLQNSGTVRDFAGVTVGGGGLIIGRITPATGGTSSGTGGATATTGFSFTGMLVTPNDVLMFQFRVDANSRVTLRTYSYAGGTNQAGQVIPAGGFDPILALFDAAGVLIGQNDDGGSGNVPADPTTGAFFDTFLQRDLMPGNYTVTVSVFPNFAIGPNLSNGFENDATSFGGRTANFAFDVLGAATATGPGSMTSTTSGPLNVIGFGRQQTATGTITGNAFFSGINFGTTGENPIMFTELSQFNTCLVIGGCGSSLPAMDPVAALSSEITIITGATLDDSPTAPAADDTDEGEDGSSEDEDDESDNDEASSPIAPPTPLINTRPLNADVNVVEPVSGAGNPALFGSPVDETTAPQTTGAQSTGQGDEQ